MKYLLPIAVLMLMVSVGMSLSPRQLLENWRRLTPTLWVKLLVATFLVPPLLALALGHLLPLDRAALAGLFLISVAPGAPLMTRGVAKKGFDMQIAATYQVWGALLTPLLVPLLIMAGGWLYGRDIWVPPMQLLVVIVRQQFAPLLAGMALMWLAPAFSIRIQRVLNVVGNVLLIVMFCAILYKLGPALMKVSPWVALAAPLLAAGCLFAVRLLLGQRSSAVQTLSICNANRHVGLAILLAGQQLQDQRPVPAIAAYALAAMLVMGLYAKFARREQAA
ncbi:MAG TPA: bile acid:sodium symporter [Chthoniobacter sp.]|nr:bile acid:sodium symporter [Chthoniobacter sp.]